MKRFVVLLILFVPLFCWAQVDADFTPQSDFDHFQQQMQQRFTSFGDTINFRFANELQRQWTEFETFEGRECPAKPRPQVLPKADTSHYPHTSTELPAKKGAAPMPSTPMPPPVPLIPPKDIRPAPDATTVVPDFYGQPIVCRFPHSYAELVLLDVSEKSVADGWKQLACDGYTEAVAQCQLLVQQMQLNDWAIFELIKSCARQLFPYRYSEQALFTVFMMNQLGYRARIGRLGNQLICLIPSQQTIYSVPYLRADGTVFYIFNLAPQSMRTGDIFTYNIDLQDSAIALDLNINRALRLAKSGEEHAFTAKWHGANITIPVSQNLIAFYENYPVADLEVYANAQPEARYADAIDSVMRLLLSGMTEYEAVATILGFLHKSFTYVYDDDQFGHEKYFFCEENFYYSGNDCEDRAVLFAYLVRRFVGAEVLLLDYPDHVATAVHFKSNSVSGNYVIHQKKKYIVCDPTYVGAYIGESMPNYEKIPANIIELRPMQ